MAEDLQTSPYIWRIRSLLFLFSHVASCDALKRVASPLVADVLQVGFYRVASYVQIARNDAYVEVASQHASYQHLLRRQLWETTGTLPQMEL